MNIKMSTVAESSAGKKTLTAMFVIGLIALFSAVVVFDLLHLFGSKKTKLAAASKSQDSDAKRAESLSGGGSRCS